MLDCGEGAGRCRQSGVSVSHTARPCRGLGREICDRLLRHLSDDPTGNRVNTWLRDADDPRLNSIVQQLFRVLRGLHD
ncbi:hydrogenase-4 component I [Escherichia coli]|nr:hydrogenase-4 component I [Escherichia coli]